MQNKGGACLFSFFSGQEVLGGHYWGCVVHPCCPACLCRALNRAPATRPCVAQGPPDPRQQEWEGLVRARLLGPPGWAGDVLIFWDCHCECHEGGLEPLLQRCCLWVVGSPCPAWSVGKARCSAKAWRGGDVSSHVEGDVSSHVRDVLGL